MESKGAPTDAPCVGGPGRGTPPRGGTTARGGDFEGGALMEDSPARRVSVGYIQPGVDGGLMGLTGMVLMGW